MKNNEIYNEFLLFHQFNDVQVELERVLGLTVTSSAAVAVDPLTATVAYPAGLYRTTS